MLTCYINDKVLVITSKFHRNNTLCVASGLSGFLSGWYFSASWNTSRHKTQNICNTLNTVLKTDYSLYQIRYL